MNSRLAFRVTCLRFVGVAVLVGVALASHAQKPAAPTQMTLDLELKKLTIPEGDVIPLEAVVDVQNANLVGRTVCVAVGVRFLRPEEKDPGISGTWLSLVPDDWRDAMRLGVRWMRISTAQVKAPGPLRVPFTGRPAGMPSAAALDVHAPAGTGRLLVCSVAGVVMQVRPEFAASAPSVTYLASAFTVVNVSRNEKKLAILDFDVVGGRTVKVGEKFDIRLEYELQGGDGSGDKLDVTIKGTLRRNKPAAGQPPVSVTESGTVKIATPAVGGRTAAVKEFTGTCGTPGECELEVEVTTPGYPVAKRVIPLQARAAEAITTPPPGTAKPGRRWIRSAAPKYVYKGELHDTPPNRTGPYWQMAFSPAGMNYSERAPDPAGKEKTYTASVQWNEPPAAFHDGEEFPLTISAGPRDGAHVLGGIHTSGGFVLSDPYAASVSNFEAAEKGRSTIHVKPQIKPYNETVTISFSAGPRRANSDPSTYGAYVQWQYTQAVAGATSPTVGSPGANSLAFATPPTPPLEAWLEPATVEVSPRSGLYSPVELRIRGVKPNGHAVQVDYNTTDGFGTLEMNRYLKVEGKAVRQTGDMWNDNQGSFPWGLKVGANLGVEYGEYRLPILVRQKDHGSVWLTLTIRVLPRGDASAAPDGRALPPVSYGQSGALEARFELPSLDLNAGGMSALNTVFVRGANSSSGEPIEVVFPQMAQKGALPGGIVVEPGTTRARPSDKWPVDVLGQGGWLPFGQAFHAKSDAPAGISMIDVVIRQRGVGEIPLRLQAAVRRRDAPLPPTGPRPPPPSQPGTIAARIDPATVVMRRGESGRQVTLYFRGWRGDVSDRVEIELPQADANGNTPEGLTVFPAGFSRPPGDLLRNTPDGEAQQSFSIGVRGDAQPGARTLFFRVRQGRYGEVTIPLTVLVGSAGGTAGGRPPIAPPPVVQPGANLAAAAAAVAQGKALFANNDMAGALAAFDKAVQSHPDGIEGRDGRMFSRFWLKDVAGAEEDGRAIVRLQPDNHNVRKFLIVLALARGLPAQAERDMDALENRLPDEGRGDADILLLRGQVQVALGMGGQAEGTFRQVMALDPQRPGKMYADAIELLKRGQLDLGALTLETVLRLDPMYADAWWALGDAHGQRGRNAEAISAFRKYLQFVPTGEFADAARQRLAILQAAPAPTNR